MIKNLEIEKIVSPFDYLLKEIDYKDEIDYYMILDELYKDEIEKSKKT